MAGMALIASVNDHTAAGGTAVNVLTLSSADIFSGLYSLQCCW